MSHRMSSWSMVLLGLLVLGLLVRGPRLAWTQTVPSCTHYGAPTGVDSGSCPSGSPCTIHRFLQVATPGSTLCLQDGVYTGSLQMFITTAPGTAGSPITV